MMTRRRLTWTIRKTLAAWLGLAALLVAQSAPLSFSPPPDPARRAAIELSRLVGTTVVVCVADQGQDDGGQSHAPLCVFCLPTGGHAPGLPEAALAVVPTSADAIRLMPNPPAVAVRPSTAHSPFAPRAPPVPA